VSIAAPANGATVSGTITVTATATDNVGVVGVQFKLDGANLGAEATTAPYSVSWTTTTATNGAHTLTAVARDAAGNVTTSTAVTVTVSNAASVSVSPTSLSFGSVAVGTTSVAQGVAITNTGSVGVSVSSVTITGPFAISQNFCLANASWNGVMAPGTHCDVFVVFAPGVGGAASGTLSISAAGGVYPVTLSGTGVVVVTALSGDTMLPSVSLTAPTAGATVAGTVTVAATAADNVGVAGVQFQLDGANLGAALTIAPYSVSWNAATAADGVHSLTAIAWDAAGNRTTSAPVSVTVANPPVISGVTAPSITSSGATVGWTTNEPSDGQVEYGTTTAYGSVTTLNTSLVTSHAQALSGLAPNTWYHYRVKSRDAAGNLAVSGDFTFKTKRR